MLHNTHGEIVQLQPEFKLSWGSHRVSPAMHSVLVLNTDQHFMNTGPYRLY